jgi:hypothetical protein
MYGNEQEIGQIIRQAIIDRPRIIELDIAFMGKYMMDYITSQISTGLIYIRNSMIRSIKIFFEEYSDAEVISLYDALVETDIGKVFYDRKNSETYISIIIKNI